MSKVFLTRIDSLEESAVNLSAGEVSIGRGSILGCDDKRISRKHGLLHVSDDGSITLVSMHSNPCFYKVQNLDSYAVLMKGQSQILSPGDEFALLPNSFRYRINVLKTDPDLMSPLDTPEGSGVDTTAGVIQGITSTVHDIENTIPESVSTTSSKRKRMLPGWLTNLSGNEPSSSTMAVSGLPPSTTATSRKRKASTDIVDAKTAIKEEPVDLESTIEDIGDTAMPDTSDRHQISDDKDGDVKPGVGQNKDGYEEEYGEASSTNRDADQNATGTSSRDPCVYGATCYRKNPQHRTEFSHPGDADFDAKPGLPECPYGTSCYRKNLQHHKDYKHTRPPPPSPAGPPPQTNGNSSTMRTRRRHTSKDGDDSGDDYDYDDPFLNDASSDDYQPTSSEDTDVEEDEDEDEESQERKRMLREAKKFTKTKKK